MHSLNVNSITYYTHTASPSHSINAHPSRHMLQPSVHTRSDSKTQKLKNTSCICSSLPNKKTPAWLLARMHTPSEQANSNSTLRLSKHKNPVLYMHAQSIPFPSIIQPPQHQERCYLPIPSLTLLLSTCAINSAFSRFFSSRRCLALLRSTSLASRSALSLYSNS